MPIYKAYISKRLRIQVKELINVILKWPHKVCTEGADACSLVKLIARLATLCLECYLQLDE